MLNYRKIRSELMKRIEKGNEVRWCESDGVVYVAVYDFMLVRLPDGENPYDKMKWKEVPGLESNLTSTKCGALTITPRMLWWVDDLLHRLEAEGGKKVWISESAFSLLGKKGDYDLLLADDGQRVFAAEKQTGTVDAVIMTVRAEEK